MGNNIMEAENMVMESKYEAMEDVREHGKCISGQNKMTVNTKDVLNALFEPDETVNIRVFDDKKGGTFAGQKYSCRCNDYKQIEQELKRHNAANRGVFYTVNFGGSSDKEINRINAQFVEMDNQSFEEQQKKVDSFPLPPSMVIKTKKSLHVYWFMDKNAKVERFREIQKKLVKYFDGDPACVNESRVMRLPGFNHCKTDTPVMVTCICFRPERRYTQEQLSDVLPALEGAVAATPAVSVNGSEKGLDIVMRSCKFLQHCKDDAATLSEPEWHAMITNLALFDGGPALIHELSRPYPGYTEAETQKKINRIFEGSSRPITCQTICARGFRCPKLAKGGCGVKSPAALYTKPLGAEILLDLLAESPVSGNALKDTQAAIKFVTDYLYNQDAATADVFIDDALRRHYKLKTGYIRTLKQVYKKVSREHNQGKLARRAQLDDLPEWYEQGARGLRLIPGKLAEHLSKAEQMYFAMGQFFRYNGGVYKELTKDEAQKIVQHKIMADIRTTPQVMDVERQWQLLALRNLREINPNPYVINLKNGLYNVLEDTFSPHTPDYPSTVQLPANYNPEADCPLFQKFLSDAMDGDMDQVKLIQEILGYCLIPVTCAQKSFIFQGVAAAGKSLLMHVIQEILLGKENVSHVSWHELSSKFKPAELAGKLANIYADLSTKSIPDNDIFKSLVGEDEITVEKKFKDPFVLKSTARLLFTCNSIPANYGDRSEGFYRRLIIIRFNRTIPEEKRDPNLLDKFRKESDGIFMFALEGLKRLMGNQYKFSETGANKELVEEYRRNSDSVLSFIDECCELGPSFSAGTTELYHAFQNYCKNNNLTGLKSHKQFTLRLQGAGLAPSVKICGQRSIVGIRIV